MSTWYPHNVPRRDRAKELDNDITMIQQRVKELGISIDDSEDRLASGIDEVLKAHNLEGPGELQSKLLGALSPQDQKLYQDLVKASEESSIKYKKILKSISTVLVISGVASKVIDVGLFLKAGSVLVTVESYGKAFITLVTKGLEAGKLAFKAAGKIASTAISALEDASKVARYSSAASRILKVIAVFGLVADAVIMAFSVYDQYKQREALQNAINELYEARLVSKFFARLCEITQTEISLFHSYAILLNPNNITEGNKISADKIAQSIEGIVTKQWEDVTIRSTLDLLVALDKKRESWVREDPKYEDAIAQATKNIGPSILPDSEKGKSEKSADAVSGA